MIWDSISPVLRCLLLAGSALYLGLILFLLKKHRLTVRVALIWLFSAMLLVLFALFPYIVLVLTDLLGMSVPINTVFLLVTAFMLLVLLSHSSALSLLVQRETRLAQKQALLEERVRQLEAALKEAESRRGP